MNNNSSLVTLVNPKTLTSETIDTRYTRTEGRRGVFLIKTFGTKWSVMRLDTGIYSRDVFETPWGALTKAASLMNLTESDAVRFWANNGYPSPFVIKEDGKIAISPACNTLRKAKAHEEQMNRVSRYGGKAPSNDLFKRPDNN